jgi:hypothetical protein
VRIKHVKTIFLLANQIFVTTTLPGILSTNAHHLNLFAAWDEGATLRTDTDGDLDYVLAFGANYDLLEDVTLMSEYRRLSYETQVNSSYEDTVNEFNFRVAVGF